jgi:hypothetical protein
MAARSVFVDEGHGSALKTLSAAFHPVWEGSDMARTIEVVDEKGRLSGPIGFQLCHGVGKMTDASFKNVVYRPLPAANEGH